MRVAPTIELSDEERKTLTRYSRGRNTPVNVVLRAKVILLAADGLQKKVIASELDTDPQFVSRWRTRFVEGRLKSIEKDGPRSGRKPSQKVVKRILEATTQKKPPGATHLSGRTLANHLGVGRSVVHRVWRQHNLSSIAQRYSSFPTIRNLCLSGKAAISNFVAGAAI